MQLILCIRQLLQFFSFYLFSSIARIYFRKDGLYFNRAIALSASYFISHNLPIALKTVLQCISTILIYPYERSQQMEVRRRRQSDQVVVTNLYVR